MNLNIALLVATSIPTRTEGDIRAAYLTLSDVVATYHAHKAPAPRRIFAAWENLYIYLEALDGVAA